MASLAQRHQRRMRAYQLSVAAGAAVTGASAAAPPQSETGEAGSDYAALRAVLHEDVRALSDIASHEARQPKKAELAAKYREWIAGVLEADQPVQDEILITNFIWAVDYRDFDTAMELARFALRHGLALPERYNRTLACFLAEDVAVVAMAEAEAVPHAVLVEIAALTADADMPDQARAKLHKALSRSWAAEADAFDPRADSAVAGADRGWIEEAINQANRALQLDPKVGVKTDIKLLEKRLRDLQPAS